MNLAEMQKELEELKTWKMKLDMWIRKNLDANFGKEPAEGIAEENPKG